MRLDFHGASVRAARERLRKELGSRCPASRMEDARLVVSELVANALRRGSWTGVLPIVGFVAVIDRFQVAAEERALAEKFGAAYTTYCVSVPRWLGPRTFTG